MSLKIDIFACFDIKVHRLFKIAVLICFPLCHYWKKSDTPYSVDFYQKLLSQVLWESCGSVHYWKVTFQFPLLFLLRSFELAVLICFTLNNSWTSSSNFLFVCLLLLIIVSGFKRKFWWHMSSEGKPCGKFQTHTPQPFYSQYSFNLLLTLPLWIIFVENHCLCLYQKVAVQFSVEYIIVRWLLV